MTFLLNLNSLTKQFLQYISSSNSREIDGRTPLVLLTLLLFKLPGLDEPFTLNTLALLPFQLLGDNSQERKSKAGRNSYSSFPISKVFSHLIPNFTFFDTDTHASESHLITYVIF